MRALILASTSVYRRELLERLSLPFETVSPGLAEEHLPGERPVDRARRLSIEKARVIARQYPQAIVIGSDQVASLGDRALDKPGSADACRMQLEMLSGKAAHFHTGCAVIGERAGVELVHLDTTTVSFRPLSGPEIERYVQRERPYDCAGGFKSEGLGIALFERITSDDPTALVGLPLIWLSAALRRAGYSLP